VPLRGLHDRLRGGKNTHLGSKLRGKSIFVKNFSWRASSEEGEGGGKRDVSYP